MSHVEETQDVTTIIRQMEGVENNAHVSGILLNIFNTIVTGNPSDRELQYEIMMGTLLEVNKDTFDQYEEHMKLPEEDRDFFLSGALSAQETFYNTLVMAYNASLNIPLEERIAMVNEVIENQIKEALDAVAEPLGAIRAAIQMMEENPE